MKTKALFYLFFSMATLMSLVEALEAPKGKLEDLQKVIMAAIPNTPYSPKVDSDEHVKIVRSAELCKQQGADIFLLPPEHYFLIMSSFDTYTSFLRFARTCKYFHALSQSPLFSLTESCLYETVPHTLPVHDLVYRTKYTKDGLVKLAGLYSVSSENLSEWFDVDYLVAHVANIELPPNLQDQTPDQLHELYALLKIVKAGIEKVASEYEILNLPPNFEPKFDIVEKIPQLMQLIRESQNSHQEATPILRILSLSVDSVARSNGLSMLHSQLPRNTKEEPAYGYAPIEVVARQLLMEGMNGPCYLMDFVNHQRCNVSSVVTWCIENDWQLEFVYPYVRMSIDLKDDDLELKVFNKFYGEPNNNGQSGQVPQIIALWDYKDSKNPEIANGIRKFLQRLNASDWAYLNHQQKIYALTMFLLFDESGYVEQKLPEVMNIASEDNNWPPLQYMGIIGRLKKKGFEKEASQLVQCVLDSVDPIPVPMGQYMGPIFPYRINDINRFFGWAMDVNKDKAIAGLKRIIDTQVHAQFNPIPYDQFNALACLAKYAAEQEAGYIQSQVTQLMPANESFIQLYLNVYLIYHYLGMHDMARDFYHKGIDLLIDQKGDNNKSVLKKFKDKGMHLNSLTELKTQDPFTVVSIYKHKYV